jgi:gluconolactonase
VNITKTSDGIFDLIAADAELETLGEGFGFLEGPTWHATQGALHFSDIPGDTRYRWLEADGSIETVASPSQKSNGMTLDAAGNLLVCEHVTSQVVRETPGGEREAIATHFEGTQLNSPNDIVTAPDGSIYFTDPPYGRWAGFGVERDQDLDFQGVFRLAPGAKDLELLVKDFEGPNGLCFSPDNSLLYINDTAKAHIRVFDVQPDGGLANDRIFVEGVGRGEPSEGVVDGMKCDERGDIFVTGPGGIWVFTPEGEHLGVLNLDEGVGNFTFGGPDWKTLFIAASTTLYRVQTKVAAHQEPYMRAVPAS